MRQREFHRLLDFLDLILQPTDVGVRFQRRLFDLHDGHHGIGVIGEDSDDAHSFVVQQNRTARIQQILVDRRQDVDVVLRPDGRTHDGMIIVNQFLQGPDVQRRSSQLIQLFALLLIALLARLEDFVVAYELLLQQQEVLDAVQFEQPQLALRGWHHRRQLVQPGRALASSAAALAIGPGGTWLEALLLLLFALLVLLGVVVPVSVRGWASPIPRHSSWHVTHLSFVAVSLVSLLLYLCLVLSAVERAFL
mmetsp:Transcript_27725/g.77678  ORF Transcript_27725/g.77678 Transcript_27725/m.77678 type:complete len:250 (-) Transcript_27725:121-870(-)